MKILKIGGILLNEHKNLKNIEEILKIDSEKKIIIISAFSKTTKELEKCAGLAKQGLIEQSVNLAGKIFKFHIDFTKKAISNDSIIIELIDKLNDYFSDFKDLLAAIHVTKQLTSKTLDKILVYGEIIASLIFVNILKNLNYNVKEINALDYMITDDDYGKAKPIIEKSVQKINELFLPALEEFDIIVTQGFIANSIENKPATMGKESSNLSAAILAIALKPKELVVWSDVAGVRLADPAIVNNPGPVESLSFASAKNAGLNGVKLIYPGMIELLSEARIPVVFKSAFDPEGECTMVSDRFETCSAPIILTCIEGYSLLNYRGDNKNKVRNELLNLVNGLNTSLLKITPNSIVAAIPDRELQNIDENLLKQAELYNRVAAVYALNCSQADFIRICDAFESNGIANYIISANYDRFENTSRFFIEEANKSKVVNIIYQTII